MTIFWCEFQHRPGGSVEARDVDEAKAIALTVTGFEVTDAWRIPYPAAPVLHNPTGTPAFCYTPRRECRNRGSCPKSLACSE